MSLTSIELLLKYDRPLPRYTSYPTAASFSKDVGEDELRVQLSNTNKSPLSLYVHVPFCRHGCWYCGCNRITTNLGSKVVEPYLQSLSKELQMVTKAMPNRRSLAQLHWGGGTPNYLNQEEVTQLWNLIEQNFDLQHGLEASIEVNPEFITPKSAHHLRCLGFNRISFGIQDADPEVQKAVNRVIPADQLRQAMVWLREANFASVNVDLICGLPLQTAERFRKTLSLVEELRPERIALFSFAYLPERLPLQRKIAAEDLPSKRERIVMLEDANIILCSSGYEAIGMDHYALTNDTLAIAARQGTLHRNFQGYTTGSELDLLGVGPTAISQYPNLFSQNLADLKAYTHTLEEGRLPVERGLVVVDPDVLERRDLIKNLMCTFALSFDIKRFDQEWLDLQHLALDGLVELHSEGSNGHVQVTNQGRWLIRTVASVFDTNQSLHSKSSRLV